jgi:transcriptional regulator with XRE-family HTH domain
MRLCRRFGLQLGEVERLCRVAYYDELRGDGGLTQAEVAEFMGKSRRTVVSLERTRQTQFPAPGEEIGLARRVESALLAGPLGFDELLDALGDVPADDLRRQIKQLRGLGRFERRAGDAEELLRLGDGYRSFVGETHERMLGGLAHQLEVINNALDARFLGRGEGVAMGRTFAFAAREEDVQEMAQALIRELRHRAVEVEEAALHSGDPFGQYGFTLAVGPVKEEER